VLAVPEMMFNRFEKKRFRHLIIGIHGVDYKDKPIVRK
jgi:hypothetical protein